MVKKRKHGKEAERGEERREGKKRTEFLTGTEGFVHPDKVNDGVDHQLVLLHERHDVLVRSHHVFWRDAKPDGLVQDFLPFVHHHHPCSDGEDDLQRVEAESSQPENHDRLVFLHVTGTLHRVISGQARIGCHGRLFRGDTYKSEREARAPSVSVDGKFLGEWGGFHLDCNRFGF